MSNAADAGAEAHNAMVRVVENPVDRAECPVEEVNTEKETPAHVLE